jgi:hypothetical protein
MTRAAVESFSHFMEPIVRAQASAMEAYLSQISELIAAQIGSSSTWFQQLNEPLREALVILSKNGWFLCMELPFDAIWELCDAFENGNADEANNALMGYFEERLDDIERSVANKFPTRARVLRAAFNAHRRGEFELSIPVFLAQSDGISKELFNGYLFRSKNKQPETAAFVEALPSGTLSRNLLLLLTIKSPINQSASERPVEFGGFNRHEVLHGDSVDYGTRANALKAVSLLNYVATVFNPKK